MTHPWLIRGRIPACQGTDPETWFPRWSGSSVQAQAEIARQVAVNIALCHTCPVMNECREYAMTAGYDGNPLTDGIWGGVDFGRGARRSIA